MSAVASKVDSLRRRAITSAGFGHIEPRPPPRTSPAYDLNLATLASKVLYRSGPDPSGSGGPLLIICAAAFPDTRYVDYNKLLPYVLSELPGDEELLGGIGYSVVFFAGGGGERPGGDTHGPMSPGAGGEGGHAGGGKWNRPAWSWSLQAYNLLSRAVRKNIKKLWIVHERAWVRVLFEAAQTVVSPKFKKKVVHVNSLSELATHIPLQALNIPPQVYLHDRKINPTITIPNPPPPMFGVQPFAPGELEPKLPQVLMECSRYLKSNHLKTEGLFRISCSMQLLEIVREAYDRGQYLRSFDYGPHVAAGLIKLYYRSLPEPLIPERFYKDLPERCRTPEGIQTLLKGHEKDGGLPYASKILLTRHLLPLLAAVAQHKAVNKMTPENLAICVSPSFVRSADPLVDIGLSRGPVCQLVKWGIEHVEDSTKKKVVRAGTRELNIKKDLDKLIIFDDEKVGDRGAGPQKVVKEVDGYPKISDADAITASPVSTTNRKAPWNSEFGGPLPSTTRNSMPPQAAHPQPPMSPIEGIPLSLQPALQPTIINHSFSEPQPQEVIIPPPLSERPTPNLPPAIPPKPAAFSISSTTSTPGATKSTTTNTTTAPSNTHPLPSLPPPSSTSTSDNPPPGPPPQAQVNTRRPSSHSHSTPPFLQAKIDCLDIDSSAVAKSVAKFQALAAAAGIPPPVPLRRTSLAAGEAVGQQQVSGWMAKELGAGAGAGMQMEGAVAAEGSGIRTWRTRQVKHLQPLLQPREIVPGAGPGTGTVTGTGTGVTGGRGLRKATSEFDLGVRAKAGGSGSGGNSGSGGGGGISRSPSISGIIGDRLNQFEASISTATATSPVPPPPPRVPRRARSNIDFRSPAAPGDTDKTTESEAPRRAYTFGAASGKRNSIVEELRQVYEERAKGVGVLVQVGNQGGNGKGRRTSVYNVVGVGAGGAIPEEGR